MSPSDRSSKPERKRLTAEQLRSVDANAAAHRFDRGKPVGGRVRALDLLHDVLVNDAQLYGGSLQDQRDAVVHSIQAVRNYLTAQGFAGATLEPLNRPALALVERGSNRLDPLFARGRGGAPRRSLAKEHRSGALAALADEWLRLRDDVDLKQEDKLRPLKDKLSGAFFGNVTDSIIKRAREVVSQGQKDHPAVCWARFYREQFAQAAELFGDANAFEIILHNLNRTAGPPERQDWRT